MDSHGLRISQANALRRGHKSSVARLKPNQSGLLVLLVEEGLPKLIGADHNGTGWSHLDESGEEAC